MGWIKDKKAVLRFSFIILGFIAIVATIVLAGGVFAHTHDATITISPDSANCEDLKQTFNVNIANEAFEGADSIYEVRR